MVRITTAHYLTANQVSVLYLVYKKNIKAKKTKKDFLEFIKSQVTLYGSRSPQVTKLISKNLKSDDFTKLIKWGLL